MWVTDTPYEYPEDVNTIDWNYNNGTQLRDPSLKETSECYARIFSWYVKGGFTDVFGVYRKSVSPKTQFVGLALATRNVTRVKDFLHPANHKPGTPLDWISYHSYATPDNSTTQNEAAQSFKMASTFLAEVAEIEAVRKASSPLTRTTINELGTMDPPSDQLCSTIIIPSPGSIGFGLGEYTHTFS
ncbi:uncharacterized protein N7469_009309 [Penicillium citrinum]|uniref:Uncharacterized protein n=1 Tax=Penicillium citrinum TaxID=5077 RepID=A0A9W9THW4_PENCI|nr:uncharacterized protein N7469_009309 [Penicillium citrinum]KAJ5223069.1 hypothetical protein N7469_009309 [Penicillium citrinum]